jgi:hypothetical protein
MRGGYRRKRVVVVSIGWMRRNQSATAAASCQWRNRGNGGIAEVVSQHFASWNQIKTLLFRIQALRQAA